MTTTKKSAPKGTQQRARTSRSGSAAVAVDASVILELASDAPREPKAAARWKAVREHMEHLAREGRRFVVPTAALAELSSAGGAAAALARQVLTGREVLLMALDDRAAEVAARLMKPSLDARGADDPRHCVKMDTIIYATAVAAGCGLIVTANARDFAQQRRLCGQLGIAPAPAVLRADEPRKGHQFSLDINERPARSARKGKR